MFFDKPTKHLLVKVKYIRFIQLAIGHTLNKLSDYLFDCVLYPYVIYQLGILVGGIVMSLMSLVVCFLLLHFYDWSKTDWLGIESIKKLGAYTGSNRAYRVVAKILGRSKIVLFLLFSIKYDPFICTVCIRKSTSFEMGKTDWGIFLGSAVVSNVYWTLVCHCGVLLGSRLWNTIQDSNVTDSVLRFIIVKL